MSTRIAFWSVPLISLQSPRRLSFFITLNRKDIKHHALDDQHVVSADGEKYTGPVDYLVHVDGDPGGDGKVSDPVPGYLRRGRTVAKEYGLTNVEEVGGEDHQGV